MDWFLYDNGLRHERVNRKFILFSKCWDNLEICKIVQIRVCKKLEQVNVEQQYTQNRTLQYAC